MRLGSVSLGAFTLTTAGSQTGEAVSGFDGNAAVTLEFRLAYGSGGTSVSVVVETSLDGGSTYIEVARADFTTAGAKKILTLNARTPRTTVYTVAALNAEGGVDGIIGPHLRAKLTSVGTYAGDTVVTVRAVAS